MRIVASGAFDVASDELYLVRRIGRRALAYKRSDQVRRVLQWQYQTERVRTGEVVAKIVWRFHAPCHGKLPISHGLPGSDTAIMAAQAQVAVRAQDKLGHAGFVVRGALIRRISLRGKSLVPERRNASNSRMRRMAIETGGAQASLDRRGASGAEIMLAQNVAA